MLYEVITNLTGKPLISATRARIFMKSLKCVITSYSIHYTKLYDLNVVGTFSDIMSYVRLFAVGLASVKIAETFNQLGAQMSHGPIIIFGIIIVLLGHTINIVLGLMASYNFV